MKSKTLGIAFLTPALVVVCLFFLLPVLLTMAFSFTNMSTATGIKGGEYILNISTIRELKSDNINPDVIEKIESAGYVVDDAGLNQFAKQFGDKAAQELKHMFYGTSFADRRSMERALKKMKKYKIRSTKQRKLATTYFKKSIMGIRYTTENAFRQGLKTLDISTQNQDILIPYAYTGWTWTKENFKLLFGLPVHLDYAKNTIIYVAFTLSFNILFGMFLALSTFYLPSGYASFFRSVWFLPRILPPVMYVLMWQWMTWDNGFLSGILTPFGIAPRNWMMDTQIHAWVVVVLINGFVGASMGMILFSAAIKAIPLSMLYASEVDGANRWQQIRHVILPQLRWPILFVTSYQTLSLLTSFEYIMLSTDGGPGGATEVWALAAYHTALNNYDGNMQYGLGASFALILVIIGILASVIYLKIFNFKDLIAKPKIEL